MDSPFSFFAKPLINSLSTMYYMDVLQWEADGRLKLMYYEACIIKEETGKRN